MISTPRLLVSAPGSSSGKTLLSLLVLAWAGARGLRARAFKSGPDFLDPQFLGAFSRGPAVSLDPWIAGEEDNLRLFAGACLGADFALVEGAMGLFDGKVGAPFGAFSTASLARTLAAPVVLVFNAAKAGPTLAATALGLKRAGEGIDFAGVVFNQASGRRQAGLLARAFKEVAGMECFGWIPRLPGLALPERHLGLAAPSEVPGWRGGLEAALPAVEDGLDFQALIDAASRAAAIPAPASPPPLPPRTGPRVRLALARDEAFHFYYPQNLDLLEAAGAELAFFSPLKDERLPEGVCGLVLGGGFPESFGQALQGRGALRRQVREAVLAGLPTWAECGGLMWLCEEMVDLDGRSHSLVGAVPARVVMGPRLVNFGYAEAEAGPGNPLAGPGERLRGHEFHHSALEWRGDPLPSSWTLSQEGRPPRREGWLLPNGLATYLHLNLASRPEAAFRFVDRCRAWRAR